MCDCIGVERCQPKVRCTVYQATILCTQGDMPEHWEIGTTAVCKHADRLMLRTCDASGGVSPGIENERASFGKDIRAEPESRRCRHAEDEAAGGLMNIGLNSRESGRRNILLRVSVITVDTFGCQPAVER